jgi:hypothetical protein
MAARSGAYVFCACALVALTPLAGCTDDGVSVHVICAIEPELEDDVCTYDPGGDTCLLEGVMNLAATRYYKQNLRVESGLKARAREVPPQAETTRVKLQSAEVELRTAGGARIEFAGDPNLDLPRLPNPYNVTATGAVAPEGLGASSVTLIAPSHADRLAQKLAGSSLQIVVAITLKGETDGETAVQSGEFLWPVTLINVSSDPAGNDCQRMDYCSNAFGQDSFANACRVQ